MEPLRYKIKTLTTLTKCLMVNIPTYKFIGGIEIRINRVTLYKTSLIELISIIKKQELYTYMTKDEIDNIVIIQKERERLALVAETNRRIDEIAKANQHTSETGDQSV